MRARIRGCCPTATPPHRHAHLHACLTPPPTPQIAHLRQQLDAKLTAEIQELEQLVTVEGGRRLDAELQQVRRQYEKQRRDAERAMVEANRQAASAMRGQLEKEHKVRCLPSRRFAARRGAVWVPTWSLVACTAAG